MTDNSPGKSIKKLNFLGVASMYVGVIMGAGFASGRESWQFFGVFSDKAYLGAFIALIGFCLIAYMISYVSLSKNTEDMGVIIWVSENRTVSSIIGYILAAFLFTTIISMTAAGGSFLYQQFGIHRAIGGGVIAVLVAVTVLGDFERISGLFKYIVPTLFIVVILCGTLVLFKDFEQSGRTDGFKASELAPTWYMAAPIFCAYNLMGVIPMLASSAHNAKSRGHAIWGTILGGALTGGLAFFLVVVLQKDMAFTDSLDLPMLGYSERLSPFFNVIYGAVLYVSIYSACTSVFYGFTTKLKPGPNKNKIIIIAIVIGYVMGLFGFKNVVAYLYPFEGYVGLVLLFMVMVNFFICLVKNRGTSKDR